MKLVLHAVIVLAAITSQAQPRPKPAAAGIVEISGEITAVNLTPGGMPSVEVASGGSRKTIRLGSIRYLMANNFNPKAGQKVTVRALDLEGVGLAAVSIENRQSGQRLVLRDDDGRPRWQRGRVEMDARK